MRVLLPLAGVLALLCVPLARSAEPSGGLLDELMRLQAPGDFRLSADGRWLAVEVQQRVPGYERHGEPTLRKVYRSSLEVRDARTGAVVWTSPAAHEAMTPAFSPDSRKLAFQVGLGAQARLWIWSAQTRQARELSSIVPRSWTRVSGLVWSADSTRLLVATYPEGMTDPDTRAVAGSGVDAGYPLDKTTPGARVAVYRNSPAKPRSAAVDDYADNAMRAGDLVLVDAQSGQWETLTRGYRPERYRISPDGRWVAFAHLKGNAQGSGYRNLFDVVVVPTQGGEPKALVSDLSQNQQYMDVSWSPDGRHLVFFDTGPGARGLCYVVEVASGNVRTLSTRSWVARNPREAPVFTADGRYFHVRTAEGIARIDLVTLQTKTVPLPANKEPVALPVRSGTSLAVTTTNGAVLAQVRDHGALNEAILAVDLNAGSVRTLFEGPVSIGRSFDGDAAGRTFVYGREAADAGPQLWRLDVRKASTRAITDFNPGLRARPLGSSRLVRWKGLEGETAEGALLLPPGGSAAEPYPLIVYLYGDARLSRDLNLFGLTQDSLVMPYENMHLLATRGHTVLRPDTRTRIGTPMRDIAASVLPAIDRLVEEGLADPDRLGIMGRSYGGYSVLSLLVQTGRFKAAMAVACDTNLTGVYTLMMPGGTSWKGSWAEEHQGKMGGAVWDRRESYIENSPFFYLDRVTTPLLIAHGDEDSGVPVWSGDELFQSLRRLDKEVEYARYRGEEHVIVGWANAIDYANRMVGWFERLRRPR